MLCIEGMLCVDGVRWLTRPEFDALVVATAVTPGDGRRRLGAVAVRGDDPLAGLCTLLAVRAAGGIPVVVDPDLDEAAVTDLVRRADAFAAGVVEASGADRHGPLLVVQTSGSSSRPRAVARTEASWTASVAPFTAAVGLTGSDVVWAPGALSSTLTLFAAWHAVAVGVPLLATGRWRGVAAAGPAVQRVSVVHCVPAVLADLLDAHAAGLLPRLRTAVVAGAATPRRLRDRARTGGVRLVEYFGAAELSFVAVDDDGAGLRPFPGCEVEVRAGQIWCRSPFLSLGYLVDTCDCEPCDAEPHDNGPLRVDENGWATVGDRGRLAAGRLAVAGRGGDSVTVGGHTVVASDVEAALRDVPGVVELACVGEPHARLGERVVAAVRAEPGADPVRALRAAARQVLPPAARPVRYVVLTDLPRTAGGKVARAALREVVTRAGRTGGRVGPPRTPPRTPAG